MTTPRRIYTHNIPDPRPSWWSKSKLHHREALCEEGLERHEAMTRTYHVLAKKMGYGDASEHRVIVKDHWLVESWLGISCHQLHITLLAMELGREIEALALGADLTAEQVIALREVVFARRGVVAWCELSVARLERMVASIKKRSGYDRTQHLLRWLELPRSPEQRAVVPTPAPVQEELLPAEAEAPRGTNDPEELGWEEVRPEYPTAQCRSCGAAIIWAKVRGERAMPVNALPSPNGNVRLRRGDDGSVHAEVQGTPAPGLYVSHFATCKQAARWRGGRR